MTYQFTKYQHYFPVYDRELAGLTPKCILEIGVQKGGSLQYWRKRYPDARIYGIDIDPACYNACDFGIQVFIGDASSPKFLRSCLGLMINPPDLIIDDGGHWPYMVRRAFQTIWPALDVGGVYVIEDLEVAFKWRWLQSKGTLEMLESMICCQSNYNLPDAWIDYRLSFYRGIVFIHKVAPFKPVLLTQGDTDCTNGKGIQGSTFLAMANNWIKNL